MVMAAALTMCYGQGLFMAMPLHCVIVAASPKRTIALKESPFKCLRLFSMYSATDLDDSSFKKIEK